MQAGARRFTRGGEADAASQPSLVPQWARPGAVCGFLAVLSYTLISAAPLTSAEGLVVACVFGPALAAASTGLYHVLRLHRPTVTLDLGLMANVAAGVTVTLMLFAQLGLKRWFELQFGVGSTDSSSPTLHATFESANGIQLGLDVAWDLFLRAGHHLAGLQHVAPPPLRAGPHRRRDRDRRRARRSEPGRVP